MQYNGHIWGLSNEKVSYDYVLTLNKQTSNEGLALSRYPHLADLVHLKTDAPYSKIGFFWMRDKVGYLVATLTNGTLYKIDGTRMYQLDDDVKSAQLVGNCIMYQKEYQLWAIKDGSPVIVNIGVPIDYVSYRSMATVYQGDQIIAKVDGSLTIHKQTINMPRNAKSYFTDREYIIHRCNRLKTVSSRGRVIYSTPSRLKSKTHAQGGTCADDEFKFRECKLHHGLVCTQGSKKAHICIEEGWSHVLTDVTYLTNTSWAWIHFGANVLPSIGNGIVTLQGSPISLHVYDDQTVLVQLDSKIWCISRVPVDTNLWTLFMRSDDIWVACSNAMTAPVATGCTYTPWMVYSSSEVISTITGSQSQTRAKYTAYFQSNIAPTLIRDPVDAFRCMVMISPHLSTFVHVTLSILAATEEYIKTTLQDLQLAYWNADDLSTLGRMMGALLVNQARPFAFRLPKDLITAMHEPVSTFYRHIAAPLASFRRSSHEETDRYCCRQDTIIYAADVAPKLGSSSTYLDNRIQLTIWYASQETRKAWKAKQLGGYKVLLGHCVSRSESAKTLTVCIDDAPFRVEDLFI